VSGWFNQVSVALYMFLHNLIENKLDFFYVGNYDADEICMYVYMYMYFSTYITMTSFCISNLSVHPLATTASR
jgi:hypothetical protein